MDGWMFQIKCLLASLVFCLVVALGNNSSAAAELTVAETTFFEQKIRPVLVQHCYECHSEAAVKRSKLQGGLRLDTRAGTLTGGDSGPALVAGKPAESLLIQAIEYSGDVSRMPPTGKLPATVIADLRTWIANGAPDPRVEGLVATKSQSWEAEFRERQQWWSLQPIRQPAAPTVRNRTWSSHPVDQFVLAKLEQAGLEPATVADKATLLRRLTFVLTGLPPTPEDLQTFIKDQRPTAYEEAVDRLLASPQFGERWATHWFDLVRYAESHGSEGDPAIPHAWRYRDYVIRAFNSDVGIDQLIREHVAGDLLPNPRRHETEQLNESILGLGHFRMVEHGFQPVDSLEEQTKTIDNQIEVVTKAFQGLTVSCAHCHNHKFDAISQRDYYAMYGIFASSRPGQVTIDLPESLNSQTAQLVELKQQLKQELVRVWLTEVKAIPARLLHPEQVSPAAAALVEVTVAEARVKVLQDELATLEHSARAKQPAKNGAESVAVPQPIAAWRFEGDARDAIGKMHGELLGEAIIRAGRLILDGQRATLKTAPLPQNITEKTLEVWVAPTTLEQQGGGVLTLETQTGAAFDSIVYAERQPHRWMAGSDHFHRTRDLGGPAESIQSPALVHLAIAYRGDGSIAFYRNGAPYGNAYTVENGEHRRATYAAENAHILMGQRHTGGGRGFFAGEIEEARLYNQALSAAAIAASFRMGPGSLTEAELVALLTPVARERRKSLVSELNEAQQRHQKLVAAAARVAVDPWTTALQEATNNPQSPLHLWAKLNGCDTSEMAERWQNLVNQGQTELAKRRTTNREQFTPLWNLADPADYSNWFRAGVGLPTKPSRAGEFWVDPSGSQLINGIYPAGVFTSLISNKQNGLLTSPTFRISAANLSIRMLGNAGGGVRVIVDNYPLGNNNTYPAQRPTRDEFGWVRLDTSYRQGSAAYLEFGTADDLTRPDKPKPPPGAQAKELGEGRSHFGVAEIVAHAGPQSPRDEHAAIVPLLSGSPPQSRAELANQLAAQLEAALLAWRDGNLNDDQALLLDYFVRRGLLSNSPEQASRAAELAAQYRQIEKTVPVPRRAPGVLESAGTDQPLYQRGNHKNPGEVVPRGFLSALGNRVYETSGSGRLELADDLTRASNPLTSRVMANRIWNWVFGRGLVATVDNFGRLGEQPSHPELLDALALRLVEERWSPKQLVRLLVTSQTFRQSSHASAQALQQDPENKWLSHMRVKRLEAEALRDALLMISEELNLTMYGPAVRNEPLDAGRRSLYLAVIRNNPNTFLEVFDRPSPASTRGQRDVTNTPAQALAMLNSSLVTELSKRWGAKVAGDRALSVDAKIEQMFWRAVGRAPTPQELQKTQGYLQLVAEKFGLTRDQWPNDPRPWQDLAHAILCLKETIYLR